MLLSGWRRRLVNCKLIWAPCLTWKVSDPHWAASIHPPASLLHSRFSLSSFVLLNQSQTLCSYWPVRSFFCSLSSFGLLILSESIFSLFPSKCLSADFFCQAATLHAFIHQPLYLLFFSGFHHHHHHSVIAPPPVRSFAPSSSLTTTLPLLIPSSSSSPPALPPHPFGKTLHPRPHGNHSVAVAAAAISANWGN